MQWHRKLLTQNQRIAKLLNFVVLGMNIGSSNARQDVPRGFVYTV